MTKYRIKVVEYADNLTKYTVQECLFCVWVDYTECNAFEEYSICSYHSLADAQYKLKELSKPKQVPSKTYYL